MRVFLYRIRYVLLLWWLSTRPVKALVMRYRKIPRTFFISVAVMVIMGMTAGVQAFTDGELGGTTSVGEIDVTLVVNAGIKIFKLQDITLPPLGPYTGAGRTVESTTFMNFAVFSNLAALYKITIRSTNAKGELLALANGDVKLTYKILLHSAVNGGGEETVVERNNTEVRNYTPSVNPNLDAVTENTSLKIRVDIPDSVPSGTYSDRLILTVAAN